MPWLKYNYRLCNVVHGHFKKVLTVEPLSFGGVMDSSRKKYSPPPDSNEI